MDEANKKKSAQISITRNGPIKISGNFTLTDIDNCILQLDNDKEVHLCSCGRTQKQPYCDESHNK